MENGSLNPKLIAFKAFHLAYHLGSRKEAGA